MTTLKFSFLDATLLVVAIASLWWLRRILRTKPFFQPPARQRILDIAALGLALTVLIAVVSAPGLGFMQNSFGDYIQAVGFSVAMFAAGFAALSLFWRVPALRPTPSSAPTRRAILQNAAKLSYALPVAAFGYGTFIERHRLTAREVDIKIPNLPKDLDGIRIAQLTDIHMSPFYTRRDLERAIALSNEFKPHVTVVTGDLITRAGDPLDECIATLRYPRRRRCVRLPRKSRDLRPRRGLHRDTSRPSGNLLSEAPNHRPALRCG